ncbi:MULTISPECIES: hypothetical protein [Bradyrhizobium]|uniref:hypothetical protein n=1 Tax=Bradyrhizobium TaxID=374 RepID=UPI003525FB94
MRRHLICVPRRCVRLPQSRGRCEEVLGRHAWSSFARTIDVQGREAVHLPTRLRRDPSEGPDRCVAAT